MIQSIVWGAVIALALRWLYRYLSVEWPERYADPEDLVSIVVSRSWWTYILFRLGPVAMAGILAVHGAQQLEGPSAVALLAMCLPHVLTSSVAAMVTMSKNEWARTTRMIFTGSRLWAWCCLVHLFGRRAAGPAGWRRTFAD